MFARLNHLSNVLQEISEYRVLVEFIVNVTRELLCVESASLLVFKGQDVGCRVVSGSQKRYPKVVLPEQGVVASVRGSGEVLVLNEIGFDSAFYKPFDEYLVEGTRNLIAAPLMVQERCIGVLDARNHGTGGFNSHHAAMLLYFANKSALALYNRDLCDELARKQALVRKKSRELYMIHSFQSLAYHAVSQEELLKDSAKFLCRKLGFQCVLLYARKEVSDSFDLTYKHGVSPEVLKEKYHTDYVQALAAHYSQEKTPQYCKDEDAAYVCVPVVFHDTLYAMILLWNTGQKTHAQDVALLNHLTCILAQACSHMTLQNLYARHDYINEEVRVAQLIHNVIVSDQHTVPHLEVAALSIPAQEMGGDFYKCIRLDKHKTAFVIGDVAGKGIEASLFMVLAHSTIHAEAQHDPSPKRLMTKVNQLLYTDSVSGIFVTALYVVIDTFNCAITYTSAGHNAQVFYKSRSRQIHPIKTLGKGLGILKDAHFNEEILFYTAGDMLLLYTDGVIEAENTQREQFGQQRLHAFLKSHDTLPPSQFVDSLKKNAEEFQGGTAFTDDFTVLCIRL